MPLVNIHPWLDINESSYILKRSTDFSTQNIILALEMLGEPHKKLHNVIHIAGTNGKGSTVAFLHAILIQSGYKVHKYTSPHIHKIHERITIHNHDINTEYLTSLCGVLSANLNGVELSFFERLTILAIYAFAQNQHDACIVEVGLGGRLDATNIFEDKFASIITSLSMDHMQILGDKIEQIAYEKAGIINTAKYCIASKCHGYEKGLEEILRISQIPTFVNRRDFDIVIEEDDSLTYSNKILTQNISGINLTLEGIHQHENFALAATTALLMKTSAGMDKITEATIKLGALKAYIPGRIEKVTEKILGDGVEIFLDVAHNEDGIRNLMHYIAKHNAPFKIGIFSCLKDKEFNKIIDIINTSCVFDAIIFTEIIENDRKIDLETLFEAASGKFPKLNIYACTNIEASIEECNNICGNAKSIFIFGSFAIVEDAKRYINKNHH